MEEAAATVVAEAILKRNAREQEVKYIIIKEYRNVITAYDRDHVADRWRYAAFSSVE